jgi:ParB-like chromosome segregation protein Spo0J
MIAKACRADNDVSTLKWGTGPRGEVREPIRAALSGVPQSEGRDGGRLYSPWDGVLPDQAPVERVRVELLLAADTPRLEGENEEHIRVLAGTGERLPPIIVHRRTMQVLDGMHRLRAAILRGEEFIEVRFFNGDDRDAFVVAVLANVAHGLPLTLADRRAAARRILALYPTRSDRAIAAVVGLSHKTVGTVRRTLIGEVPQSDTRIGRDGRERRTRRPERRRAQLPVALKDPVRREAARGDTARRDELPDDARGEGALPEHVLPDRRDASGPPRPLGPPPSPDPLTAATAAGDPGPRRRGPAGTDADPVAWERLRQDPALRFNEWGRLLLRLLAAPALGPDQWRQLAEQIPAHQRSQIAQAARVRARGWLTLAESLDTRSRDRTG